MLNLPDKLVEIIGRIETRRDNKKTNFTKSFKEQEVVESHVHPHPKE